MAREGLSEDVTLGCHVNDKKQSVRHNLGASSHLADESTESWEVEWFNL